MTPCYLCFRFAARESDENRARLVRVLRPREVKISWWNLVTSNLAFAATLLYHTRI